MERDRCFLERSIAGAPFPGLVTATADGYAFFLQAVDLRRKQRHTNTGEPDIREQTCQYFPECGVRRQSNSRHDVIPVGAERRSRTSGRLTLQKCALLYDQTPACPVVFAMEEGFYEWEPTDPTEGPVDFPLTRMP